MTPEIDKQETDHERLARLAQSVAGGRTTDFCDDLGSRSGASQVKLFAGKNRCQRFEKRNGRVEFIVPVFDDFDKLAAAFVQSVSLSACESGAFEGERFLQWLERMRPLSREQRDYVTCQRARQDVREMARENRQGHVRFQELLGVADDFVTELETNPTLRIRLNPIRVWRQFETRALLGDDSETPADVIFYPVANSVRAAVLKPVALERIQPLCRFGSCTVVEWLYEFEQLAGSQRPNRAALIAFSRELVKFGLIAFA